MQLAAVFDVLAVGLFCQRMLHIFSWRPEKVFKVPRWTQWCITTVSILTLLPVFYIGIYNHPAPGDDYQNAVWSSFLATQLDIYLHWSGRYFINMLTVLCPLHWHSFAAYRIVVVALILAFTWFFAWLIRYGLRSFTDAKPVTRIAISAIITALLVNNFYSLSESFYWFTGAITYLLPATLVFCLLAILVKVSNAAAINTRIYLLVALLTTLIIGSNETMLIFCDLLVFVGCVYYKYVAKATQQRFYKVLFLVCVLCTVAAIAAPGNFERQSANPRNIAMAFPTWLYFSQKAFFRWISDPYFLFASALTLLLLGKTTLRTPALNLLAAFLLPFIIILLLNFPAYATLGRVPLRVLNMVYTFFVLGWFMFLLHLHYYIHQVLQVQTPRNILARQMGLIVIIIGLLASFNNHDLRRCNLFVVTKSLIRNIPQHYSAELHTRYKLMTAATNDTARVPPLQYTKDNLLVFYMQAITSRSTATQAAYAEYWGAKMVMIDTSKRSAGM